MRPVSLIRDEKFGKNESEKSNRLWGDNYRHRLKVIVMPIVECNY